MQATAPTPAQPDHSLTDYVADFIVDTRHEDIPADVMHLGKRSVLDGIGLALAGAASEMGGIIRRYLDEQGIDGDRRQHGDRHERCSFLRASRRSPTASSIHADDYDDTQLAVAKDRVYGLLTHPTAPALPPALALAERDGRSGRDMMLAYQVGVEVECKVAEAILPRHYQHGFHSTATCGAIGAAAAAAKLLGLDRDDDAPRAEPRRQPGRRAARELRHDDEAVSRGARRRERRRRGRAGGARIHRVAERPRSRSRLLPRGGRRLQRGHDRGQARQAVDVRVAGRVDQAASERLAHASGHER